MNTQPDLLIIDDHAIFRDSLASCFKLDTEFKYYLGGIDAIIEEFRPYLGNGLVREGLEILREKFSSIDSVGPVQVADFERIRDSGERDIIQRDAFELVRYFLTKTGFINEL